MSQSPVMIDVRDADAMLRRSRDAERTFERGPPVRYAARELLGELADVLADSRGRRGKVAPTSADLGGD